MVVTFEIRQEVRTICRQWLETIFANNSERVARSSYETMVQEHPEDYFELVRVERDEACLAFTPLFKELNLSTLRMYK